MNSSEFSFYDSTFKICKINAGAVFTAKKKSLKNNMLLDSRIYNNLN